MDQTLVNEEETKLEDTIVQEFSDLQSGKYQLVGYVKQPANVIPNGNSADDAQIAPLVDDNPIEVEMPIQADEPVNAIDLLQNAANRNLTLNEQMVIADTVNQWIESRLTGEDAVHRRIAVLFDPKNTKWFAVSADTRNMKEQFVIVYIDILITLEGKPEMPLSIEGVDKIVELYHDDVTYKITSRIISAALSFDFIRSNQPQVQFVHALGYAMCIALQHNVTSFENGLNDATISSSRIRSVILQILSGVLPEPISDAIWQQE